MQALTARRERFLKAVLIALVFSFSFFVFFYKLDAQSFHIDEVTYTVAGQEYLRGRFERNLEHPFLGKYMIGLSLRLLGRSDFTARLPSALMGFLTGIVIYRFAREVTDFWFGLMAVALWSISPAILWVSRRAILDAPFVFFFVLGVYAFWRLIQTEQTRYAVLAGVAVGLGTAVKLVSLQLLPIAGLYVGIEVIRRRQLPRISLLAQLILVGLLAVGIFFVAYAPVLDRLGEIYNYMSEHWAREQQGGHRMIVAGTIYQKQPWWTYLYWYAQGAPRELSAVGPALLAVFALSIGFAVWRHRPRDVYLLLAFFVPFVYLSFYLSFKMFRYADAFQPALVLLATSFLFAVVGYARRTAGRGGIVVAVLIIVLVVGTAMMMTGLRTYRQPVDEYKAVAQYLAPELRQDDRVFVWGYTSAMWWYLLDSAQVGGGFYYPYYQGDYRDADYIVVDYRMISRWPDDPVAKYLQVNGGQFKERVVGDFHLYTRAAGAESEVRE